MPPKTIPPLAAAALCLALAACGDEPSASEMQQALSRFFAGLSGPEIAMANLDFGGKAPGHVDDPTEIANVSKVGCAPAQPEAGYVCEFKVTLNGIDRPGMKGLFRRGADGRLALAKR